MTLAYPTDLARPTIINPADHPPLRGRGLRWVLLDELKHHPQLSIAQMVTIVAGHGFHLGPGRPSKIISDALRWELRRGRIQRPTRGVYRWRGTTPATSRRITILATRARTWITHVRHQQTPPPFPPKWRRARKPNTTPFPPQSPPWTTYGWLWDT